MTTQRGATDFVRVIEACEALGPYCLIGGLAVNCYVEPVYTLDADRVLASSNLEEIATRLAAEGFLVERHEHPLNARGPQSQLRIQFTIDDGYQPFLARAVEGEVLGLRVKVACLEDVTQEKLWAYADSDRRSE